MRLAADLHPVSDNDALSVMNGSVPPAYRPPTGSVASPAIGGCPDRASALAPRSADPEAVLDLLVRTACASGSTVRADTHETHISWVFIVGGLAFKLKKPIVLEFLDYGTPARRRAMCEAEVALNGRLAPNVYRTVRAIVPDGDELTLAPADDPRAVDYMVEMNAFAPEATLAAAVRAGTVPASLPAQLGACLASFHAGCSGSPIEDGAARARREISTNLAELRELTAGSLAPRLDRFARFLDASVTAHAVALDDRGRRGRLREGHGDLRAEHVLVRPELAIVDCLEFDPEMRTLDTADELAFLAMDLLGLDAEPLAHQVLRGYRRAGGDCGGDDLLWMFAAHRALVRAKVGLLRATQLGTGAIAPHAADDMFDVAARCAWRGRAIDVLVICGGSATGKSHLATALSTRLAVPCLNTDIVRKDLLGLAPHAPAGAGAYTPQMGLRTYTELGTRTRALLAAHPTVIVDGTFRGAAERTSFTAALGDRPSIVFVQCWVPPEVARQRARKREHSAERVSDASERIVVAQGPAPSLSDDVPPEAHILLRTDRDLAAIEADLDALLDARLSLPCR
jgi:aminoglycoside phosphotransferase family enzyme/predicted kinase